MVCGAPNDLSPHVLSTYGLSTDALNPHEGLRIYAVNTKKNHS